MSDYTPPTLVIPTPGGNPGDGSLNGALTVQANTPLVSGTDLLNGGSEPNHIIAWNGSQGIQVNKERAATAGDTYISVNSGNEPVIGIDASGNAEFWNGRLFNCRKIAVYELIVTSGLGVAPIYGDDARTGLTAADASAKTLYTTTAAGQLYRLMGRILATAGTSPSATYTIKWTEGGATITKTLTISALDSDSDLSILIQPDNGTAITAQLTAISGTGTTVNVAATVEQMA